MMIKNPVDDILSLSIEQFEKIKIASKMAARIRKTVGSMEMHVIIS